MVRLRIAFGVASSLVALAALSVVFSGTGLAQGNGNGNGQSPQNVTIVNTPLPVTGSVTASVTGNVNAAVTGDVNANVSGTVGLASGAAVQIAGTADVVITNTDAAPVPVFNAHDAREVFQRRITLTIEPGSTQTQVGFDVPEGKRLVIEHVSSRVQGPAGERYIAQFLTQVFGPSGGAAAHWLTLQYQGTFSGVDILTANHDMRGYADPSFPSPQFIVTRTGVAGNTFAELNISGYLVNQ